MLVGNVLEKTKTDAAWQVCADKLADWVRTDWQNHVKEMDRQWEDACHEEPLAVLGLSEEGFRGLVGVDYIFKWWGADDTDELAGALDVIWKVMEGNQLSTFRTWIKFADRDFILGVYKEEGAKRDKNREEFRSAFAQWRELFLAR